MEVLTLLAAGFFALNIGASGTAASMGAAYGGGAVSRRTAVWLVAAAVFAGAFGGGRVTATLGSGIVPEGLLTAQEALVILGSASATLFVANLLGIPLSTSAGGGRSWVFRPATSRTWDTSTCRRPR
jgi:sulfate permease